MVTQGFVHIAYQLQIKLSPQTRLEKEITITLNLVPHLDRVSFCAAVYQPKSRSHPALIHPPCGQMTDDTFRSRGYVL